jgi:hypothetical protein
MVQKHREQRNKGSERENKLKKCVHDKILQVNIITICNKLLTEIQTSLRECFLMCFIKKYIVGIQSLSALKLLIVCR